MNRLTAVRMAEEGCAVAILDRLDREGQTLSDELTLRGFRSHYWHCDVTKEADVARAIDAAAAHFGSRKW
jgi:NAD(P)-dependent dehydrogenase (short-subunit alcohol dehydrogenase family)